MLLTSFIAGFLGSLSPCVYPLIPITLSVMGIRRYDSHWHGFRIALSYVAGMVLLHTALGVLFAYLGILAGSSLQSPWLNAFLTIMMLLMALSLMGVFNWTLPPKFTHMLTRIGAKRGHKSSFLMGLVAGVIAVPCTGPILAGILTKIAETQDMVEGSYLMFSYGLGMGLPFLVLGTFSSSISKLPKGGPWMNRIKILLGLILIWMSFNYAVAAWSGFAHPSASEQNIEAQIDKAHAANKTVVLDFWADWCTLCHEMDEKTFGNETVKEALKNVEVIRVDVTVDSSETRALQEAYGIVGLPTLVFLDSGRKVSGFVGPKDFLELLNER
ncbi:MAG: cytochrome c biogenesis protein CcdA [Myxococcota bacterium]